MEIFNEALRRIRDARWICRGCAATTYYQPWRGPLLNDPPRTIGAVLPCPECGGTDWEYTAEPVPDGS